MQIAPNFPAKSLSIYAKNFLDTFLTENYLCNKENLKMKLLWLNECIKRH